MVHVYAINGILHDLFTCCHLSAAFLYLSVDENIPCQAHCISPTMYVFDHEITIGDAKAIGNA